MNLKERLLLFRQNENFIPIIISFIFALILVPVIIILLTNILSKPKKLSSPTIQNPPAQIIDQKLKIISVTPTNNSTNNGTLPVIRAVFSRPLTKPEQKTVSLTTVPAIQDTATWSYDGTTVSIVPTSSLHQGATYQARLNTINFSYDWIFTIASLSSPSPSITNSQSQADKNYGELWKQTLENYPWYNSLPLQTKTYFVYFDLSTKEFTAKLYPTNSSSQDTQVSQMKQEILSKLTSLGVDITQFKINWLVTPAS